MISKGPGSPRTRPYQQKVPNLRSAVSEPWNVVGRIRHRQCQLEAKSTGSSMNKRDVSDLNGIDVSRRPQLLRVGGEDHTSCTESVSAR